MGRVSQQAAIQASINPEMVGYLCIGWLASKCLLSSIPSEMKGSSWVIDVDC
jgi:hypothetical protein